jgi:hypothetical protein
MIKAGGCIFVGIGLFALAGGMFTALVDADHTARARAKWEEFNRGKCSVLGDDYKVSEGFVVCRFKAYIVFREKFVGETATR